MTIQPLDPREVMVGSDFLYGALLLDSAGNIVGSSAAVARAEVHIDIADFSTPGARWEATQALHRHMEVTLKRNGMQRAWTFFAEGCDKRFFQRLLHLNWCKSDATLYYRELRG